ncbi:MAG: FHA domain-containing protein [Planctomycetota bacterium]
MELKISVHCEVEGELRSYDLEFDQDVVTIGSSAECDCPLPGERVGDSHARILTEGDRLLLEDLGVESGIELDGARVESGSKVPIDLGAEIRVAAYRLVLGRPELNLDESTSEKTSLMAMQMVREVLGSLGGKREPTYFEVLNDSEAGSRLEIAEADAEYSIGRESACDLILKHWSISRRHALIRKSGERITVLDLGSKNGVALNGEKISEPQPISDGDVVAVGHTELRYRDPSSVDLDALDDTPPAPLHVLKDLDLFTSGSEDQGPPADDHRRGPARPGRGAGAAALHVARARFLDRSGPRRAFHDRRPWRRCPPSRSITFSPTAHGCAGSPAP